MRLSVLVPVYNERDTIEELLRRVRAAGDDMQVIAVDDFSTDGTRDVLGRLRDDGVIDELVLQPENRGKGAAIRAAVEHIRGDAAVVQDADFEYDPAEYPRLLELIESGEADVVYGSRFATRSGHRLWHYLGNRFLTMLSNLTTGFRLTDMETCYKVLKAEVWRSICIEENRFGLEPELTAKIARGHWRVREVNISYVFRSYAEGKKINWKDGVSAIRCILKYGLWRRLFPHSSPTAAD